MKATAHAALIGVILAGFAPLAQACGFCIEDRVAAVYDHAVVTRAVSQKHQVVFFAMEGVLPGGKDLRGSLKGLVGSVAGIDKDSVRISVETASFSAAFDPGRMSFASVERALSNKFSAHGVSLALLRVMDGRGLRKPD